jgi:hypothetical protein
MRVYIRWGLLSNGSKIKAQNHCGCAQSSLIILHEISSTALRWRGTTRRRPASDVFRKNPDDTYLSVNLLGVESFAEIASYYRELFQGGTGRVAICENKLTEYNRACDGAGVRLTYLTGEGWTFLDRSTTARAYERYPLPARQGLRASPSHSGVEYVRVFDELAENAFARRLAKKRFSWHD